MAVYPPSYGVQIGNSIRETEASRLHTRGSDSASLATSWQPASTMQASPSTTPTAKQQNSLHPFNYTNGGFDSQEPSNHPSHSQQEPVHGFGAFEATDLPQNSAQPSFASDWGHYSSGSIPQSSPTHYEGSSNAFAMHPHLHPHRTVALNLAPHAILAQQTSSQADKAELDAIDDDDRFRDFAEAPPSPQRSAAAHQAAVVVSDRQGFASQQYQRH